jgi:hypothetical protein
MPEILVTTEINPTMLTASISGMCAINIGQAIRDESATANGDQGVSTPGEGKYQPCSALVRLSDRRIKAPVRHMATSAPGKA